MSDSSILRYEFTDIERGLIEAMTKKNVLAASPDEKRNTVQTLLSGTGRNGVDNVISFLETSDYFTAPSSMKYHSNYDGGLVDHSLLVLSTGYRLLEMMKVMNPDIGTRVAADSLILTTLLHDTCKCSFYKAADKWRKDSSGRWESYKGYEIDDRFPIGHGEKSVIMLQKFGLDLNAEEMLAIRWHMGTWDGSSMNDSKTAYLHSIDMSPLLVVVQTADSVSSLTMENIIRR